jgi:type VI secretion system protein ImpG
MDDLTLRYYDAEMRYLLEAGEEFARAHPEQAAMLNLDKAGARPVRGAPVRRLCLPDGPAA